MPPGEGHFDFSVNQQGRHLHCICPAFVGYKRVFPFMLALASPVTAISAPEAKRSCRAQPSLNPICSSGHLLHKRSQSAFRHIIFQTWGHFLSAVLELRKCAPCLAASSVLRMKTFTDPFSDQQAYTPALTVPTRYHISSFSPAMARC